MVFSSLVFVCIFLPITIMLNAVLQSLRMRNGLLIIASLLFYAYGEPVYVGLIFFSTVVNYIFGRMMEKESKRWVLCLALIIDLGTLGLFKYSDLFVETINRIWGLNFESPGLRLPIGISFFTFQIMSYVIDVFRGNVKAQKSFMHLLLYIIFFPQLIAGPIIQYHDIAEQITERKVTIDKTAVGLRRFIIGLAKKVLIANVMASAVDGIFALSIEQINCVTAWIGAIAYLMQIYYDFSGYSDMAIGMGQIFGFRFTENFRYPYAAVTIQDFWHRWHISLSNWFKTYLYIPLGGNRKGKVSTCINKMIVFFCTGLWHGANWTFVLWGLYHGVFLLIEEVVPVKRLPSIIGHLYNILIVTIGFVIFRADSISKGIGMITRMFTGFYFTSSFTITTWRFLTPLMLLTMIIAWIGVFPWKEKMEKYYGKRNDVQILSYAATIILMILSILSMASGTYNPFIYFRF